MKPIVHLKHISEINQFVQSKTKHPLVSVVDFGKRDEYLEEDTRLSAEIIVQGIMVVSLSHAKPTT